MAKAPAFQFYPADWKKDPAVRSLTPASRGVWWDLICSMWETKERCKLTGTIDSLSRIVGCSPDDIQKFLDENAVHQVADVTVSHGRVTVTCRRMARQEKERQQAAKRKRRERMSGSCHGDVTVESENVTSVSSSSSSTTVKESSLEDSCPIFPAGSEPYDLAVFLAEKIRANNERARTPDLDTAQWQMWCKTFDLMIRRDGLDPGEIAAIISWCQSDDFWQTNIISPSSLRNHYPRLYAAAKKCGAPMRLLKEE